jgi:hypothetical protein
MENPQKPTVERLRFSFPPLAQSTIRRWGWIFLAIVWILILAESPHRVLPIEIVRWVANTGMFGLVFFGRRFARGITIFELVNLSLFAAIVVLISNLGN